jgi:hypothetical protein
MGILDIQGIYKNTQKQIIYSYTNPEKENLIEIYEHGR